MSNCNPISCHSSSDHAHQNSASSHVLDVNFTISKYKLNSSKLVRMQTTTQEAIKVLTDTLDDVCAVCFDNVDLYRIESQQLPDDLDVCVTGCGHTFHYRCISIWMSERMTCPKCCQYHLMNWLRFYYAVSWKRKRFVLTLFHD